MPGLRPYRFKDNPEERLFAEAWALQQRGELLRWLLGDGEKKADISDRDETVAATVIQWLGSPVGQCFLRDLGYEKARKT